MAKIKTVPGNTRGKKNCPECQTVVGVRTKECPKCKHVFEAKTKAAAKAKVVTSDLYSLLEQEKSELEETLASRTKLEARLAAINNLLKTM